MTITEQVVQYLVAGIAVGMVYGLVGLGINIVYNASGAINFAQGEFVMLGGMGTVALHAAGLPLWLAAAMGVVGVAVIGLVVERVAIAPMRDRPPLAAIIATIGASLVLQGAAKLAWGPDPVRLPPFSGEEPVRLAGAGIEPQRLWVLGLAAVSVLAVQLFFARTLVGKAMRAVAEKRFAARLCGIAGRDMTRLAFAMSAGLSALIGVAVTPVEMMRYSQGAHYTLTGFLAAVVGGLGNGTGAVVGGLALGLLESFSKGYISSGYARALALGVALLLLWVRPQGLLGGGRAR